MTASELTEEQLLAVICAGDPDRVFALLEPRPPAELKRFQKMLAKVRTEQRQLQSTDWNMARTLATPLVIAGVLCSDTPAQAASWLGVRELFDHYVRNVPDAEGVLVRRHDSAWLDDLALRLAKKFRQDDDLIYWRFVDDLANSSGALLPLSPAYVRGWLQTAGHERWEAPRRGEKFVLTQWLRKQPRLRECVEAVFATDDVGSELTEFPGDVRPEDSRWPKALAELTAEGLLDRGEMLDACAARLLRGDRPASLRGVLDVFEELAPTPAEVRERLSTYEGMAASGAGTVAKVALRELRALDAEQPFEPMDLAALSESILVRPESGTAVGQLAWLDAALKRDPGAINVLLPCFGVALTHPVTSVQQRALKLLGKRLKAADHETVSGLREAALSVDPALKAEADVLFAPYADAPAAAVSAPAGGSQLPPYQPSPMPAMPSTPEELVTALALSYTGGETSPLEAEQILAAVAVLSHRDRAGLAEVFRPLYDRYGDQDRRLFPGELCQFPTALRCLLDAVLGKDHRRERIRVGDDSKTLPKTASIVLRIQELTHELLDGDTVPLLLATPTEPSGAVNPTVLESRLVAYRTLGIKPLPLDLAHARLRAAADPAHSKAFAELPIGEDPSIKSFLLLPEPPVGNGAVRLPEGSLWSLSGQPEFLSIMLPHDPDLIAALELPGLYHGANGMGLRTPPPNMFPSLAETAGVPGPLTHLALVYALAADSLGHRIAAQDAVLIFAARGLLRPDQLGRFAALAWQADLVRGKRIVDAFVQLEESGASAEVFEAVVAMLDPLSKTPEIRGLPEVLLLATRAAVSAGIRDVDSAQIPGLAELAAATKPKRVGVEARRLLETVLNASGAEA
jgi:hypothetical protein